MEAVFALADRITVLVYGRVIASGAPEAIRANAEVRQAYLGEQRGGGACLTRAARGRRHRDLLRAAARCCSACRSPIAPGEMVTLMGRNGMGKTTTVRSIMGLTPAIAGSIRFAGEEIRDLPVLSASRSSASAWCRRAGRFSRTSPRARTWSPPPPTAARRADPWTLDKVCALFPRLAERHRQHGQPAVRRRAADAGGRPRADDQSAPADPRRGDRGPRAADPRRDLALPGAAQGRKASRSW